MIKKVYLGKVGGMILIKKIKIIIKQQIKNSILSYMLGVSEKAPQIKYLVIDTLNAIMIADEMARAKEKILR